MKLVVFFLAASLLSAAAFAQEVSEPVLDSAQLPKYPDVARTAHVAGDVHAKFTLDASGNVTSVRILSGNPLLTKDTEANIRTWKFVLPKTTSVAEKSYTTVFTYRLSDRAISHAETSRLTVTLESFRHVEVVADVYGEVLY